MRKANRLFVMLVSVLFVLFFVFSFTFVACGSRHECNGANCRICEEIQLCQNFLRSMSFALCLIFAASVVSALGIFFARYFIFDNHVSTPVALKVKLSD